MTRRAVLLPDVVMLVRRYLLTDQPLAELVGTRITSRQPASPVWPAVTVQRIGGTTQAAPVFDRARVQIDSWAEHEDVASLVARTVRARLEACDGWTAPGAGTLSAARLVSGPTWLPDTGRTPPLARWSSTFDVLARP